MDAGWLRGSGEPGVQPGLGTLQPSPLHALGSTEAGRV